MATQVEIEHLARALHEAQVDFDETWESAPAMEQTFLRRQARRLLEKFIVLDRV